MRQNITAYAAFTDPYSGEFGPEYLAFCAVRILWRCFREQTKNSFAKNCRTLAVWQFVFQVMIAVKGCILT